MKLLIIPEQLPQVLRGAQEFRQLPQTIQVELQLAVILPMSDSPMYMRYVSDVTDLTMQHSLKIICHSLMLQKIELVWMGISVIRGRSLTQGPISLQIIQQAATLVQIQPITLLRFRAGMQQTHYTGSYRRHLI